MSGRSKPTPVFGAIAYDGETIVPLPISQLQESLGKQLYFQHQQQQIPQLCRTNHDIKECRNLHAKPEYLQKLGDGPLRPCCAFCNCHFSRALMDEEGDPRLQLLGPVFYNGVMYPMERLMITAGVVNINPMDVLPASRVCQDHLEGYCWRSKDCNLIHLCRSRPEAATGPFYTKPPGAFTHPQYTQPQPQVPQAQPQPSPDAPLVETISNDETKES